jgi:hypothetical protein
MHFLGIEKTGKARNAEFAVVLRKDLRTPGWRKPFKSKSVGRPEGGPCAIRTASAHLKVAPTFLLSPLLAYTSTTDRCKSFISTYMAKQGGEGGTGFCTYDGVRYCAQGSYKDKAKAQRSVCCVAASFRSSEQRVRTKSFACSRDMQRRTSRSVPAPLFGCAPLGAESRSQKSEAAAAVPSR